MTITEQKRNEANELRLQTIAQAKLRRLAEDIGSDLETIPDYDRAKVEAIRRLWDFEIKTNVRGGYEDETDEGWKYKAYSVAFIRNEKQVAFNWKQGLGIMVPPLAAEVLAWVCRDHVEASEVCFEDWAANFGFDSDSRKAEASHSEAVAFGAKLKKLGLLQAEVQAFADLANRF